MKIHLLIIPFLLFHTLLVTGQDDHYWSQQFGATASSMGGAVIGGVRDNSAIFYNPGGLSFIDNNNLSVDANLYKLDKIKIQNGGGQGVNLNSSQMSTYPQIVSGLVKLGINPKIKIGYCILTKNYNNILINTRFTNNDLAYNPNPSVEFIGALDYSNLLNEQWFGLCLSYRPNPKNGLGLSLFGNYRGQTYSLTNFVRNIAYEETGARFSTVNLDENIKYWTFMLTPKLGWAYESGRWRLGVTLTFPSIQLYGKGSIQREISYYSATDHPGDTAASFIILDRKSSLKTHYQHPGSIAAGVEYQTSRTRLALSLEFFAGIKSYYMMKTESDPLVYPPWVKDSLDIRSFLTGYLDIRNKSRSVLNAAIGINQVLSERFSLLMGARTDFSSFMDSDLSDKLLHNTGEWDLYHVSAGIAYSTPKQTITLGYTYTFSPKKSLEPYGSLNPFSTPGFTSTVFAQSFGFVLGYTHYLK